MAVINKTDPIFKDHIDMLAFVKDPTRRNEWKFGKIVGEGTEFITIVDEQFEDYTFIKPVDMILVRDYSILRGGPNA